jgi:hypothetical protein
LRDDDEPLVRAGVACTVGVCVQGLLTCWVQGSFILVSHLADLFWCVLCFGFDRDGSMIDWWWLMIDGI